MATTYTVSNTTELQAAMSQASGGDTILLEPGSYGAVSLNHLNFSSYVTVRSADPDNEAVFTNLKVENSSYIRIDDVHVSNPSNGVTGGRIVNIEDSHHIEMINSEVNGLVDDVYSGSYGLYVKNSSYVDVTNNYVHDVSNGIIVFGGHDHLINENYVDYIYADFFKFGGVTDVLIENNTGGGHMYPGETTHADFMQFQGQASDVIIRGNVYLAQVTGRGQGIFLADANYTNILIEQNILYVGHVNAIRLNTGSGITVRDNTVLNTPDAGFSSSLINVPSGSVVENNIYTTTNGGMSGSNVVAQWGDVTDEFHYATLFENAMAGLGITLEDLRPVEGSAAEYAGAYERLMELLEGTPYVPEPSPAPAPASEPDPVPLPDPIPDTDPTGDGDGGTQGLPSNADALGPYGTIQIDSNSDVVQIAPAQELALASATISLSFNANTVTGSHGILSRDASNYSGGGNHFTSYINDGTLYIRFQDGNSDMLFSSSGIAANTDYDLQIAFGDGNVYAWLDGVSIGAAAFDMSWATNVEYMQIGANGWASGSGQAGFTDVFYGTISNVTIVEGVFAPVDGPEPDVDDTVPPVPDPEPVPPTTNDDPVPTGDGPDVVYSLMGDTDFQDNRGSIITVDHDQRLEISEGSIAFSFNADNNTELSGLISKDASEYLGGGNHFSAWLDNGALHVRFQDEDSDASFVVDNINANQEYDVLATFDADEVSLYVDGALVGSSEFAFDLGANHQYMQIGGLGWSSKDGSSLAKHAFDGTISNVMILDEAITPHDVDLFS